MKFKSALVTAVSGSIGGMTGSHNRGGQYLRARVIPTNTSSEQQQEVREAIGTLSNNWNNVLTEDQREAWRGYAFNTPSVNAMGDSIKLSGLNMYTRCNVPRIQAAKAVVDDAPLTFDSSPTPTGLLFSVEDGGNFTFSALGGDPSLVTDFGLIFISRPQNAGINFFAGPYRFAGSFALVVTGEFGEVGGNNPFPAATGQKVFARVCITRADGRLSGSATASAIVT